MATLNFNFRTKVKEPLRSSPMLCIFAQLIAFVCDKPIRAEEWRRKETGFQCLGRFFVKSREIPLLKRRLPFDNSKVEMGVERNFKPV
jgi:hypothetical protein